MAIGILLMAYVISAHILDSAYKDAGGYGPPDRKVRVDQLNLQPTPLTRAGYLTEEEVNQLEREILERRKSQQFDYGRLNELLSYRVLAAGLLFVVLAFLLAYPSFWIVGSVATLMAITTLVVAGVLRIYDLIPVTLAVGVAVLAALLQHRSPKK